MTDFAMNHKADWLEGQFPKMEGATHIVYQDSRYRAYDIEPSEVGDFYEWVAAMFSGDNDPVFGFDFDGDIHEYFDEIGVSIRAI